MNDQSQLMNQHQMLNSQMVSQPAMVGQMNPPQMMNPMVTQSQMVAQPPLLDQSKMMPQSYGGWAQQPPNMPPIGSLKFPNQMNPMYGTAKPGRNNWKGKKAMDKRKDVRRRDMVVPGGATVGAGGGGYQPPTLNELEHQNRLRARRFYHKKKFNRMGPYAHAPRNTTSYLIRAKKEGGIASLVSPCPVTPAVLPSPVFSPSREALVDMAKEEWGVDGYGSMKGLIRLRSSPGHEAEIDDYEDEDDGGSSESDVEEHLEVERRLDHDLSRFEMIYPNYGMECNNVLENRVDDQDTHIAQLEEENLLLKEKLYLMEREFAEIKRRMQSLERQNQVVEDINEEVVENVYENESEGTRAAHHEETGFDGNIGEEALQETEQEKAITKENCQDESLDGKKEETQDMKENVQSMDGSKTAEIGSVNAEDETRDMKENVQSMDGGKIAEIVLVNAEPAEDHCMEGSATHKEPENAQSER